MEKHIELVPCYTDRALFLRLAKDYVETLQVFDRTIRWDEATWSEYMWESRFILEDRTIQGFIITQEIQFKLYGDLLYISEFYIVPEARHKGIGEAAVKAACEKWHGDVFLYVLDHNFAAKGFWEAVESDFGWKRAWRPEIRQEKGCELRAYCIS